MIEDPQVLKAEMNEFFVDKIRYTYSKKIFYEPMKNRYDMIVADLGKPTENHDYFKNYLLV